MEVIETKERFIQLRAKGYSFDKIAKELGKAKQTLIDWSKELQDEIANLKAMELEALYQTYYLYRENRLQGFGIMLHKIREEIEGRDLSDVSTDKLLDLYLKYDTHIREDFIEPTYKSSGEIREDKTDRQLLMDLSSLQGGNLKKLKTG